MEMKFHLLGLLLLSLALASVHEDFFFRTVSAALQYEGAGDEGSRGSSMLDLIELEYQADVNGLKRPRLDDFDKDNAESSAKKQSESQSSGQKNSTVTEKTISFSLVDESENTDNHEADVPLKDQSTQNEGAGDEGRRGSSMLDLIELEYQAHVNGLKEPQLDGSNKDKDDEAEPAKKQNGLSMLDLIELEYEAHINGLKEPKLDGSNKGTDDEAQPAKKQNGLSMLDLIELEYEAHIKGLKEPNLDGSNKDKDDETQPAKKGNGLSMLDLIEREYEADINGLKNDKGDATEAAKKQNGLSMLDLIELEYEAHINALKQPRLDEKQPERKRKGLSMLELIEREYAADLNRPRQPKLDDLNQDKDDEEQTAEKKKRSRMLELIELEYAAGISGRLGQPTVDASNEGKGLDASAKTSVSNPSGLMVILNQLVQNHRNAKVASSKVTVPGSSSSTQAKPLATSESIDELKAKFNDLHGISFRDLVLRSDFDEILAAAARLEEVNSNGGYISRLAKYRTVIKEGIEATRRTPMAKSRAKLLKEIALEKQAIVDAELAAAKGLVQRDDALYEKISALKDQLARLEAEKDSVHKEFHTLVTRLAHHLVEVFEADEEYQEAVNNTKHEEAAQEFAREAAESAEAIWVKFLSSL